MMYDRIDYKNYLGESITFGTDFGVFVTDDTLRTFVWEYSQTAGRISKFSRKITEESLPVYINCGTTKKATEIKEHIYRVAERDVRAAQRGRLIVGDYYLACNIIGHDDAECLLNGQLMLTLKIASDHPFWIKEHKYEFLELASEPPNAGNNKDYAPLGYPYDYTSVQWSRRVFNESISECNFLMTIYGPCTNPWVSIDEHIYQINVELSDREKLTIDSRLRRALMTKYTGSVVNVFSRRNKDVDKYPFEKIKPGVNVVSKGGDFGVDIILFDERSEPKW